MIFSCTKKVQDKLKKYKPIESNKEETGFYNWYVDLINLERKNYFLFTNSKTLFTFFVYAGTKKELTNIENIFENKLEEQIIREVGTNPQFIKKVFNEKKYRFVKTNSRSILGSMNDFKIQIKIQVQHKGKLEFTYDLINHLINEVPMGTLKYAQPVEVMRKELESIINYNPIELTTANDETKSNTISTHNYRRLMNPTKP